MVTITELVAQIKDLAQIVLELESGFDLVQKITIRQVDIKQFFDALLRIAKCGNEFIRLKPFARSGDNSFLALNLLDYDLICQSLPLVEVGVILSGYIERGRYRREAESALKKPEVYHIFENLRISLALIPYIAAGDKNFLVDIGVQHIPNLLDPMVKGVSCSYDSNGIEIISSDQYFAICQLVKNAQRAILYSGTAKTDNTIEIKLQEDGTYPSIVVGDKGTGISANVLPLIFGSYTKGGTGIGLQVIKRILDLRGGYSEVISTQSGKLTFKYDTRTGTVSAMEQKPQGSTFILYFPKS